MSQIARPVSDVDVGSWTATEGVDLWDELDEEVADDDSSMISAVIPAFNNAVFTVALGPLVDPRVHIGHKLRVRCTQDGFALTADMFLLQGLVQIAVFDCTPSLGWTTFEAELSPDQAALITNYADLRVMVNAQASAFEGTFSVTQVAFDIPDVLSASAYDVILWPRPDDANKNNVWLRDPTLGVSAPSANGSAIGNAGFTASVVGKKGAAGFVIGASGLSENEIGRKEARGAIFGAFGLSATEAGSEGAASFAAGAVGITAQLITKKNAIAAAVGSIGLSDSLTGSKQGRGFATGTIGLTASTIGAQIFHASGFAVGALGITGETLGLAGDARAEPVQFENANTGPRYRLRKPVMVLVKARGHAVGALGLTGSVKGVGAPNWKVRNELSLLLMAA